MTKIERDRLQIPSSRGAKPCNPSRAGAKPGRSGLHHLPRGHTPAYTRTLAHTLRTLTAHTLFVLPCHHPPRPRSAPRSTCEPRSKYRWQRRRRRTFPASPPAARGAALSRGSHPPSPRAPRQALAGRAEGSAEPRGGEQRRGLAPAGASCARYAKGLTQRGWGVVKGRGEAPP